MMCSELATYALNTVKRTVVINVYRRKIGFVITLRTADFTLGQLIVIRLSSGRLSSSRSDQKNTTIPMTGGVRKTICHEPTDSTAIPMKGASTGVNKKIVSTSDMICAMRSPTKQSRTPAMVVVNTAEAPTPAMNLAASINGMLGANAAANPPTM